MPSPRIAYPTRPWAACCVRPPRPAPGAGGRRPAPGTRCRPLGEAGPAEPRGDARPGRAGNGPPLPPGAPVPAEGQTVREAPEQRGQAQPPVRKQAQEPPPQRGTAGRRHGDYAASASGRRHGNLDTSASGRRGTSKPPTSKAKTLFGARGTDTAPPAQPGPARAPGSIPTCPRRTGAACRGGGAGDRPREGEAWQAAEPLRRAQHCGRRAPPGDPATPEAGRGPARAWARLPGEEPAPACLPGRGGAWPAWGSSWVRRTALPRPGT